MTADKSDRVPGLRWRRAIATGAVLTAAIALFAASPIAWHRYREYVENRITPTPAEDVDARAILRAVLVDQPFYNSPPPPRELGRTAREAARKQIVVIHHSMPICPESVGDHCPSLREYEHSQPLPRLVSPMVRLEPRDEVEKVFAGNGWGDDFYAKFPGTAGFVEVTWPVLSEDRERALIYVGHSFDGLGGVGHLYLLKRRDLWWAIVATEMLWIS